MPPLLRATRLEFRLRFWIIAAIFFLGFSLRALDPVNAAVALVRLLAPAGFAAGADRDLLALHGVFAFGALLAFAAAALRTWAAAYLDSSVVHDGSLHAEGVVADGPFRFVRNPFYLGTVLLAAGMALLASRLGWVVIVGAMVLFTLRLIGREEAELTASQGESYAAYKAAVPRVLPALLPRVPRSSARPRWGQAFLGESFMWSFALALAAFAATYDPRWFFLFLALGFLATFLFKLRGRSSRPPAAGT